MDPEKTAAFDIGSGPDACLLLHGFTGSPWDLRILAEALAARGYHVKVPLLPGHGQSPRALERVDAEDWRRAASAALASLQGFRNVFVCGLSMGALLALRLAAREPGNLQALALLAPAIKFVDRRLTGLRLAQKIPFVDWNRWYSKKDGTDIEDPLALAAAPILAGFPLGSMRHVFTLQEEALANARKVRCPVLVAAAHSDHVVRMDGARALAKALVQAPSVRFIALKRGFHIMPRDYAADTVAGEVADFFHRQADVVEGKRQA